MKKIFNRLQLMLFICVFIFVHFELINITLCSKIKFKQFFTWHILLKKICIACIKKMHTVVNVTWK